MLAKRGTIYILTALAVILCLVLVVTPVSANPGLKVTGPLVLADEVAPGQHISYAITVSSSEGDPPMDIQVDVMGFGQSIDGRIEELDAESDISPYSARQLLTVSVGSFHLDPGGSQEVIISGDIPADVGNGGRYAVVYIHTSSASGGGAGIASAIDIPVLLAISGTELVRTGSITEIALGEVVPGEPIDVSLNLKNTGNYHYKARAEVTLKDEQGNILATASSPLCDCSIIPGYARQYTVSLAPEQAPSEGTFYVESSVFLEDGSVLDSNETRLREGESQDTDSGSNIMPAVGGIAGGIGVGLLLAYFLVIRKRSTAA